MSRKKTREDHIADIAAHGRVELVGYEPEPLKGIPLRKHPRFGSFSAMYNRCTNPNCPRWMDYGGRGIKIASRWDPRIQGFRQALENYSEDLGPKPLGPTKWTADRIDNDGDYAPENMRWASVYTQNQNQRKKTDRQQQGRVKAGLKQRGQNHPRSKLTDQQVVEMRELGAMGEPHPLLAEKFGVSEHTVSGVCMGKTYAYAGGPLSRRNRHRHR